MWEYSINISRSHSELASSLFNILRKDLEKFNSVVVLTKEHSFNKIVLAVPKSERPETEIVILRTVKFGYLHIF